MTDMLFGGFPDVPPEPVPELSPSDKRHAAKERRDALLAERIRRGYHPLVTGRPDCGLPLLGENRDGDGHTCGDCAHRYLKRLGGTYPKCELGPNTGGPATDVLAKYPACFRWEPKDSPE